MSAGEGELIAFATAPKKTASDNPEGRNGLFTEQLASVLREPGLELRDVFKRVKAGVYRASAGAQLPYVEDGVIGDFVLNGAAGSAPAALAVPVPEPAYVPPATAAAATEGEARTNAKDGLKYAWIPPGRFDMGCVPQDRGFLAGCGKQEKPRHPVTLTKGFWLAQTEVTVAAYRAFANATARPMPKAPSWLEDTHPIVNVTWGDAVAFCDWSGGRLPTEAEWEYAARAGTSSPFPWGDELEPGGAHRMNVFQGRFPSTNTMADGFAGTAPVDAFAPNEFGLYNVTGNVWEWCADWYDPGYYARSPLRDPRGPVGGTYRVMRGGSYLCHNSYCRRYRVSARQGNEPASSTGNVGFRVAADPVATGS